MSETKRCTKCGEIKPVGEFGKDAGRKDGLKYNCKCCTKESHRKYYAENTEKRRESQRKYCAENPEKRRESTRKYKAANPEKDREHCRKGNVTLTDSVVANRMKLKVSECTPELIELKREQLKLARINRELKKELKDVE